MKHPILFAIYLVCALANAITAARMIHGGDTVFGGLAIMTTALLVSLASRVNRRDA
jgi:hypothetical protein